MKKILLFFYLAFAFSHALAQKPATGSLRETILSLETDSTIAIPDIMANPNIANYPDSSIYYARQLIAYGRQHHNQRIISQGFNIVSYGLYNKGNYPAALNMAFQSLRATESGKETLSFFSTYNLIGNIYKGQQNFPKALFYYRRARQLAYTSHNMLTLNAVFLNLAFVYNQTGLLDSALYYSKIAAHNSEKNLRGLYLGYILGTMGDVYFKLKNYKKALELYLRAYAIDKKIADFRDASMNGIRLARYYNQTGKPDSGFYYLHEGLNAAKKASFNKSVFEGTELLARMYEAKHQPDSAFKYLKLAGAVKDSLYNAAKSGELENLTTDEFLRQNEIQAAEAAYHARLRIYALIFTVLVFAVGGFLQLRNSLQRKRAFVLLQKQNAEIEEQKAEALIEAALERVRSGAMAMQNSDELAGVVSTVLTELTKLNFSPTGCLIWIIDPDTLSAQTWMANPEAGASCYHMPHHDHPYFNALIKAWKERKPQWVYELKGEEKHSLTEHVLSLPETKDTPEVVKAAMRASERAVLSFSFSNFGGLQVDGLQPLSEEKLEILSRFAKVFDQTYTRFYDLKNAEAQARESQVQLALERIRARTMAMQKSGELAETVSLLFKQLLGLGIKTEQIRTCGIVTFADNESMGEQWITETNGEIIPQSFTVRYDEVPAYKAIYKGWKDGETFMITHLEGDALKEHLGYLAKVASVPVRDVVLPQQAKEIFNHVMFFSQGCLFIITKEALPAYHDIFKRFGAVFQQSYTRFLDLQKAEEQARESQIQLALERVRARTMAMQHSEELPETSALLFHQVKELGEEAIQNSIAIVNEETGFVELSTTVHGSHLLHTLNVPINDRYLMAKAVAAWKAKRKSLTVKFERQELKDYNELRNSFLETKISFPEDQWIVHISFFSKGWLSFSFDKNISGEIIEAQKRFAAVFDQTYTRFLDLQRAEAQSREAQIELALERVRARTMAMLKSDDLAHAVAIIFEEMDKLNLGTLRCGIGILDKEKCSANVWTTTKSEDETVVQVSGDEPMDIHPLLKHAFDVWANQDEDGDYVLQGEDLNDFYKALTGTNFKLPGSQLIVANSADYKQYYYVATFQSGNLYAFRDAPFTTEAKTIIKRFANVFDFTYTRFNDLKQAEQQLREAIKQASLDRVRGEIASMRTTKDLERITPLIWNELTILGIPFIRCGVFIVDDKAELIHTHLSTPDGKALAAFDLTFDAEGIGREVLSAWRKKQMAAIHWSTKEFAANTKNLVSQGTVKSRGKYVTERPDTALDLHFFPFLQGMLYAGNSAPLTVDEKDLVQSLADAFSTAYARYEDFNKLELAKQQVEHTLTDLKAAQTKLVQSEKMASLGELTAGIAHEIQNPLNFVNNFSEVNREMIDELEDELKAGNIEEALAIAADIKQNEEKINHHGKRADSIVKGMLQHSRTAGGEKLLTNINSLADEFMRLSYHGLRAKDKSFNAEMVTDFDPDLPKAEVVAQDIGRVMLNLFNNAFYAVNQKAKTAGDDYKPEVSVSTSTDNGHVILKVRDNGIGIPEAIKDKIMQPFFTTKPTGEGTGLGLSLTYDMVVKGHGGSITVDTKEGAFTCCIITLPLN